MVSETLHHLHHEEALLIISPLEKPKKLGNAPWRNHGHLNSTHATLTPRGPREGMRVQELEPTSLRGFGSTAARKRREKGCPRH